MDKEENVIMKIAVTSKGKDLDAEVDPRFGRAAYILIVDSESFEYEVLDNAKNANAFKGAGIQAAAMLSESGAEVLLTGYCGPNAFRTLNAANIKIASDISGAVRAAVANLIAGNITFSDQANVDGHW